MSGLTYIEGVTTLDIDIEACTGCGMCLKVCPHPVFELIDGKAGIVDRDLCIECGACVNNCPEAALRVEPGVGCASAILKGWLTGSEPSCGCDTAPSESSCGCETATDDAKNAGGGSCCC